MKKKIISFSILLFTALQPLVSAEVHAPKDSKSAHGEKIFSQSPEELYTLGLKAYNKGDWSEALRFFSYLALKHPDTRAGQDGTFYLGVSNFHLKEYDAANAAFSSYITREKNPQYFDQAIEYKFFIAEQFRCGEKRRIMGSKKLPKWLSGRDLALEIYEEVILAMPSHEIAARALFYKGCLQMGNKEYRESIETFQSLIKRFPMHELTPEAYININCVYLEQSVREYQNPDLLSFAELNLQKFKEQFPSEPRIQQIEKSILDIQELHAGGFFKTAQFYERIRQPKAAVIYYQKALVDFPQTQVANRAKGRLERLAPGALKVHKVNPIEDFEYQHDFDVGETLSALDEKN